MINHFSLSALLSRVRLGTEEELRVKEQLLALKNHAGTQEDFFRYCRKYKLAPIVYMHLRNRGLLGYFTETTRRDFADSYQKVKQQNEARNREARRFLAEFEKAGIEVAILKGNLLIHTIYNDAGYKKMNDFDILIKKQDWQKVQEIYFRLGYLPLGFGWSGEKQKPAQYSHVGMSFISPDFKCIIGTQWGLKSPTTTYNDTIEKAWQTARYFDFYGVKVKQLSPEFNLLHLILHIGIYKIGTRDCMDIYNLWDTHPINQLRLLEILREANAIEKARFALILSKWAGGVIPQNFLEKLRPQKTGYLPERLRKRLLFITKTNDLHSAYNDYFQDIEKNVLYMGIFHKFHQKLPFYLKLLRLIWFPPQAIGLKLLDKTRFNSPADAVVSRMKLPHLVFALIAQEIGALFTFLLYNKLFFDLLFSAKNYVVKKETYFEYLEKKGIDPKAIQNIVTNIQ